MQVCVYPYVPHPFSDLSETMNNPNKPAWQYVNKGKRQRQVNKALADFSQALEDSRP